LLLLQLPLGIELGEFLEATDECVVDKDLRNRALTGAIAKFRELVIFAIEIDLFKRQIFTL
jgi:hypothetical protein